MSEAKHPRPARQQAIEMLTDLQRFPHMRDEIVATAVDNIIAAVIEELDERNEALMLARAEKYLESTP